MSERYFRNLTLATSAVWLTLGCDGRGIVTGTGNTNWVVACEQTSECSGDLTCQCNLCGPTCEGTLTCMDDGGKPVCDTSQTGATEGAGGQVGADGAAGQAGAEEGESPLGPAPNTCAPLATAAPDLISADFNYVPGNASTQTFHADDVGLHWFDASDRLMSILTSSNGYMIEEPFVLREAESGWVFVQHVVAEGATLYWVEEARGAFEAGIRLFAMERPTSQRDLALFEPELLYEGTMDGGFSPFGVNASGVYLRGPGDAQLSVLAPGEATPRELVADIPFAEPYAIALADDGIYWRVPESSTATREAESYGFFRTDLNGESAEFLASTLDFPQVKNGRMLWTESDPEGARFWMFDSGTACAREISTDVRLLTSWLLDDSHVYWQGMRGLTDFGNDYRRTNLLTGATEQISLSGFDTSGDYRLVAQNSAYVFVDSGGRLRAIEKAPWDGSCIRSVESLLGQAGITSFPRQDCGELTYLNEGDSLAEGKTAVDETSAAAVLECLFDTTGIGVQFSTVGYCIDCSRKSTYLRTELGDLYHVSTFVMPGTLTSNVERCENVVFVDDAFECVNAQSLHSCDMPFAE